MAQRLRKALAVALLLILIPLLLIVWLLFLMPYPFFGTHRLYTLVTARHPWQWLRSKLGWGMGVGELVERLGIDAHHLRIWTPHYRRASIPKRGGRGRRELLIPAPETKQVQRAILHRLLKRLRAHPAACGFERGRSIVDNAQPHANQAVVVRMDVRDFFPSIRAEQIERYFRRIGWNREAAALLVKWTTHDGVLPQGAPTSPRLSNLVNYFLDVKLTNLAGRVGGRYTRYADDITLSLPKDNGRRVRGTIQAAQRMLRCHGYEVHQRRKLSIRRRHQRQEVTGLVVNDGVRLPRKTRRWLRAVRHRIASGRPATLTVEQLQGWLAFERMVESTSAREPGQVPKGA